jgi:hypothetical protein
MIGTTQGTTHPQIIQSPIDLKPSVTGSRVKGRVNSLKVIGEKSESTYSAVSQRISVLKQMLNKDIGIEGKYLYIKSLIKI